MATCLQCESQISDHRKFCSCSCAAKYNNKRRKTRTEYDNCAFCGEPLKKKVNKYCSSACSGKARTRDAISDWKTGKSLGYDKDSGQTSPIIRQYILEKYEYRCTECGWGKKNPFNGNWCLELHHIDGDHTNVAESNLTVLCPNCHSMTNNVGTMNKGNRHTKSTWVKRGCKV